MMNLMSKMAPPAAGAGPMTTMQHLIKGDRNMLMSSDDNMMMKQMLETHSPDGRSLNVRPLLQIVEDIISRSSMTTTVDGTHLPGTHMDNMEDKTYQASVTGMLESLSQIIDRISCEMLSKCLSGTPGHATSLSLLQILSSYPWDAKLVLTLAAFSLSYGEFWLLAQIFSTNQLARSMAILKQVPVIMEHSGALKSRFDAVSNLVNSVMELTRTIVALEELPSMYITQDVPAMSTAIAAIPTAVYWSIRSIIACATQLTFLTSMGQEYAISSSTELGFELPTFAHKINRIHEHLKNHLYSCYEHIETRKNFEAYESLKHIFEMIHIDNMKVLRTLIYAKDDILPLFDGSSKKRVSLDVLRRRNVLLLISGLGISQDELSILEQIYNESRGNATSTMGSLYEVVWMPIVDHYVQQQTPEPILMQKRFDNLDMRSSMTTMPLVDHSSSSSSYVQQQTPEPISMQKRFDHPDMRSSSMTTMPIADRSSVQNLTEPMQKRLEELRSTMPWYSVYHPSIIDPAVVRFVKERWHFRNKPILVVLDPQGRELSPNAIHMMWIWGSSAFPFTSLREDALWREEIWRLDLLVSGMDPVIFNWIREGKYIILYGGEDIEWIRRFTATARAVAQAAHIPLELAYVGKSTKREQVRRAMAAINGEKLSHSWQDQTMTWFFWTRLESMLFSKIQLKKTDDPQDPILQEIKKLLSYDKSGGWALLSKGSFVVTSGHGSTVLATLLEYDAWKENVPTQGFDIAFKEYHGRLHVAAPPCCRFEFSTTVGRIPDGMRCTECLRHMEKYSTFLCCHDDGVNSPF